MLRKIFTQFKKMGIKNILLFHLGLLCCAISSVIFISPAKMVASGATGLAKLLNMVIPLDISFSYYLLALNIIFIVLSFIFLGKEYSIKTIYGSIMLPIIDALLEWILLLFGLDEAAIIELICSCDPSFVVIFAGALMGFGIGVTIRLGGSTGGFDVLESILNKYFHLSFTTSIIVLDTILIIFGMIVYSRSGGTLFANGFDEGLGAIVYVILVGLLIDTISFGGYNKRAVFITSSKHEEVRQMIIKKLTRGLTLVDAKGGFSKSSTEMIICICYAKEYYSLREAVEEIDENAFIFCCRATEVRGLGFTRETQEHLQRHHNIDHRNDL